MDFFLKNVLLPLYVHVEPHFMPLFSISFSNLFKQVRHRDLIRNWKLSLDDRVLINSGKAKGCTGRIVSLDKERNVVKVQGCNLYSARDKEGNRRLVPRAVHYSNVNLIDPVTDKPTRIHIQENRDSGELERLAKKSNTIIAWPRRDVSPTKVKPNAKTGPKDTEVEFALEKTYDYHKDVETMKLIRAGLTKYNNS